MLSSDSPGLLCSSKAYAATPKWNGNVNENRNSISRCIRTVVDVLSEHSSNGSEHNRFSVECLKYPGNSSRDSFHSINRGINHDHWIVHVQSEYEVGNSNSVYYYRGISNHNIDQCYLKQSGELTNADTHMCKWYECIHIAVVSNNRIVSVKCVLEDHFHLSVTITVVWYSGYCIMC